jgi:hypothetical protein
MLPRCYRLLRVAYLPVPQKYNTFSLQLLTQRVWYRRACRQHLGSGTHFDHLVCVCVVCVCVCVVLSQHV